MKKLLPVALALALFCLSAILLAGCSDFGQDPAQQPSLTGKWNYVLYTDPPQYGDFTLIQESASLRMLIALEDHQFRKFPLNLYGAVLSDNSITLSDGQLHFVTAVTNPERTEINGTFDTAPLFAHRSP